MGASFNFYMFHGGTDFGFMNGANRFWTPENDKPTYTATITSYDYDAPLSEAGWITEKYMIIQDLMKQYNPDFPTDSQLEELVKSSPSTLKILDTPSSKIVNAPQKGSFFLALQYCYMKLTDILTFTAPTQSHRLMNMEHYGQNFGFIAYRASLASASGGTLVFEVIVADRLQVILNGKTIHTVDNNGKPQGSLSKFNIAIPPNDSESAPDDLILLVENLGRVNYDEAPHTLQGETKGLTGSVSLNDEQIHAWDVYNLDFNQSFMAKLTSVPSAWKTIPKMATVNQRQPVIYATLVSLDDSMVKDYFLDTQAWSKGVAFINNFNLGRYWKIGPQRTLYVPKPLLQRKNTVIMFELEKPGETVNLADHPDLGINFKNMS